MIWQNTIILAAIFGLLFALGEFLYRVLKWRAENSRKVVHMSTGLLALSFPYFFDRLWPVLLLCGSFLLILVLSLGLHFLPSINLVKRKTIGSVLFPIIVALCFYLSLEQNDSIYFFLPIILMAVCDPLAALAGNAKKQNAKSMAGFWMFFGSATVISLVSVYFFKETALLGAILFALALAVTTAVAEFFSKKGWDNFSIPATAAATIYLIEKIGA